MEFLEVINAKYLDGYRIHLWFNNNEERVVDLSSVLCGAAFEPLKNIDYFKDFTIHYNTIEWKNGADFAPEYLYKIGQVA